jgi:hypothetical protein
MILRATTRRTGERRSHGRAGRGAQAGISVSWAAEGVAAEEEGFEPGGFGALVDAVLDARELRLDFALVSPARRGGGDVLLPFAALTLCEDLDQGQRLLCVDRSPARLEEGPRYERRADGSIDVDALRRAREAP